MAASIKNWEAQARTNSILAGSLKALEERVADIGTLLDWRNDAENQFEDILTGLTRLEAQMVMMEQNMKTNTKSTSAPPPAPAPAAAVPPSPTPAAPKPDNPATDSITTWDVVPVTGDAKPPAAPISPGKESEVESPAAQPIKEKVTLVRRALLAANSLIGTEQGLKTLLVFHFACYLLAAVGFFVSLADLHDGSQAVAGLVAVLYTVSIGLGIVGATLRSSRMLALFLCWQHMLSALTAVFIQRSFDISIKETAFCNLSGVIGVPDKNCNQREVTASTRVVLGIFALCVTVSGSFIALLIKDIYTAAEVQRQIFVSLPSLSGARPRSTSDRSRHGGAGAKSGKHLPWDSKPGKDSKTLTLV
mmetsp:Transcript_346/g.728  ORF Transcript_346/g.728 Transcript_346/m.728 type:complete len:362 (-) Transcript_346:141-1226(-)|eukprot:CAMPEP_0114244116 /NCGR_PEP_ID=MMETSP0058-20121206/11162_1 /TAXON_ID=36894 /ORGANISM="Pyramimonas parkeae, CCMP726" /LENGTH=361 /DNA_ID=CAMNT_0001357023 /DNA_START=303 /DNA_END=1388 /DNA_ORIENTATION=+